MTCKLLHINQNNGRAGHISPNVVSIVTTITLRDMNNISNEPKYIEIPPLKNQIRVHVRKLILYIISDINCPPYSDLGYWSYIVLALIA